MKFILVLIFLITIVQGQIYYLPRHGIPPADLPYRRAAFPRWGNIEQPLDNFNASNTETWNMRFMENDQFYRKGGPIFIMLGAEWTINQDWLMSGQMFEMAETHKAYMFYTEHRYYGKSYPTSDLSSKNLRFLTTDQALADIANFIIKIKSMPVFTNSKVVVFGGSYGGSLAIWMRQKYPNLVHAAVSSSAPVQAKVDFYEYNNAVQKALGTECASVITNGIKEAIQLLNNGNISKLQKDFNLCWEIDANNLFDIQTFFFSIASQIGNEVQYSNQSSLVQLCYDLLNPSSISDYDRLAAYSRATYDCKGNYNHLVKSMTNINLYNGNSRQWIYQSCTEFGFFQTSNTDLSLYSQTISMNLFEKWCHDFFGEDFTANLIAEGVAKTNKKYRALNPQVTRVVSVHGTVDPWNVVGLKSNSNSQAPVIVVPGTSHCADMFSLSVTDSPELKKAQFAVKSYISQWLQD